MANNQTSFPNLAPGKAAACIQVLSMICGVQDLRPHRLHRRLAETSLSALVGFHHAYHAYFGIEMSAQSLRQAIDPINSSSVSEWFAHASRDGRDALAQEMGDVEELIKDWVGEEGVRCLKAGEAVSGLPSGKFENFTFTITQMAKALDLHLDARQVA